MGAKICSACRAKYAEGGSSDVRCYWVNCGKIAGILDSCQPQ